MSRSLASVAVLGLLGLLGSLALPVGASGCAGRAAPVRAADVRTVSSGATPPRLLYPVVTTSEGDRFISLERGPGIEGPGARQIEYPGDGFYLLVAPATGPLPTVPSRFTVLTSSGPCDLAAGEVVVLDRRAYEADFEEHYGRASDLAVEVSAEQCDEALFAYPAGSGTTLTIFDLTPPEFEEPQHGAAEDLGLTALVTYPPSEDGICPGFPPTVVINAGATEVFNGEVERDVGHLGILDTGAQRYIVIGDFFGFSIITLSGVVVERASYVGAIDLAETCL